jgi:lipopolysaccharide/colanic/teichoic acid biosynthesis glycosyltransferase
MLTDTTTRQSDRLTEIDLSPRSSEAKGSTHVGAKSRGAVRDLADRILAGGLFLLASPVLLLAGLAVWIEDGRPVIFRQNRVGRNGIGFQALKLRSMRLVGVGSMVTAEGDSRITRTGRILRKYKLDELPQLWNVVRGDMSLVGPRPEVPRFVDLSNSMWQEVLSVRPGITDATTLIFRNEESLLKGQADPERYYREHLLPEKLRLQVGEVRNSSFWSDMRVLGMTVYYSFLPSRFDADSIRRILLEKVQ